MTNAQLEKWGQRYGLTLAQCLELRKLFRTYARQQERACNGDAHPSVRNRDNKNANSDAWTRDSDVTGASLESLARAYGFTHVDFGVGLYPVLERGEETCIMVP